MLRPIALALLHEARSTTATTPFLEVDAAKCGGGANEASNSKPISQRRRSCSSTDAALASANVQAVRQWTMRFVDAIEAERLTPLVDADGEIDRDDVDGAWSPTLRWLALQLAATSERRFPLRFSKVSFVMMMMNDCLFFVSSTSAVGALLFLRLICPALTTPVESGLLPASNATTAAATTATQKALVTISKILQTLANQVLFCLFSFLSLQFCSPKHFSDRIQKRATHDAIQCIVTRTGDF